VAAGVTSAATASREQPAVVVELTIPARNEAHVLATTVERVHRHATESLAHCWHVTIADSASTDDTLAVARRLEADIDEVSAIHVDRPGRGRALRAAWEASDAQVVAYMDADLSTDLEALAPMVDHVVADRCDIAVGSRLAPGATVERSWRREIISRTYNGLLRGIFHTHIRDAQCGFKAMRSDVARALLADAHDQSWFLDTELLLLAEHRGLRIEELPVHWIEDRDSRVQILRTAADDLKGMMRVARTLAR